jgi:hypothetical protein
VEDSILDSYRSSKSKECFLLKPETKRNHLDGHLPLTLQAPCTLLSAKSLMYKVLEKIKSSNISMDVGVYACMHILTSKH